MVREGTPQAVGEVAHVASYLAVVLDAEHEGVDAVAAWADEALVTQQSLSLHLLKYQLTEEERYLRLAHRAFTITERTFQHVELSVLDFVLDISLHTLLTEVMLAGQVRPIELGLNVALTYEAEGHLVTGL